MKRVFCAAAAVWTVSAFAGGAAVNGDFELFNAKGRPLGWSVPAPFTVERTVGSNGSAGLLFENDDPSFRQTAVTQRLSARPGQVFSFGGWVNVERMKAGGSCMFAVIWTDARGRYIGETQTESIRAKTKSWVKLEGISRALPTNAVSATFGVYCRKGSIARIAVDKVFCAPYVRRPVAGVFTDAYRDEVTEGPVKLAAALTPAAFGTPAGDVRAVFSVRRPDGSRVEIPGTMPAADEARAEIDAGRLGFGTNRVACSVWNGSRLVGTAETVLERRATPRPRDVRIDRFGRTIVDGKPFFPLGMMLGAALDEATVDRYADSPFNCAMPYGQQPKRLIDRLGKAGIKVIYYLADRWEDRDKGTNFVRQVVAAYKDHPAVMGWYIYDEKPTAMIPVLAGRHRLVVSLDKDHPTWVAQDLPVETRHYLGSFDVFGGDPYPVPYRDIATAGECIREQERGLMGVRSTWQVPQWFSWTWYREKKDGTPRCPTAAEFRNMSWQAIAGGARGLVGFIFNDRIVWAKRNVDPRESEEVWSQIKRIAAEIRAHERVLLLATSAPVPAGELPKGVMGRTFEENGERWKLLVNTTYGTLGGLGPLDYGLVRE